MAPLVRGCRIAASCSSREYHRQVLQRFQEYAAGDAHMEYYGASLRNYS